MLRIIILDAREANPSEKPDTLRKLSLQDKKLISHLEILDFPNSALAYWIPQSLRSLYKKGKNIRSLGKVQLGLSTKNDERFLRLYWEVSQISVGSKWHLLAKGGKYDKYYSDIDLVVEWANCGEALHEYIVSKFPYLKGNSDFVLHRTNDYHKPGLTWPARTQKGFSIRTLPQDCLFANKGPSLFINNDRHLLYLGILNSSTVNYLVRPLISFGSYEVGSVANIPTPQVDNRGEIENHLECLAYQSYLKKRNLNTATETSHAFRLPWLLQFPGNTLAARFADYGAFVAKTDAELARLQHEIDELAFDLYELSEEDRALIRAESGAAPAATAADPDSEEEPAEPEEEAEGDDEEEATSGADLATLSHALLSWCVGVAFGRWDVRMALDSGLIPELQGPFERLPGVAPAGLVGVDGYPAVNGQVAPTDWLRARPNVITLPDGEWRNTGEYPLPVAWSGVLVSDPGNPLDLTARVRAVLRLLFGDASERIEDEALRAIRGTAKRPLSLEEYFANPKFFFATHLKGYSRSRRKAPIYWPLTHPDAPGFVVWVYYPTLRADTLPRILTEVLGPRIDVARAEVDRTSAARDGAGGSGPQFRQLTEQLEAAQELLAGLEALRTELRRLVDAGFAPDHDDGVIITASPLHGVFPWKDLAAMFRNVQAGKYPWSHQHGLWAKKEGA